ncbi:hypothetical protein SNK03_13559 [Fusarium graminearum]|uniref:Chromosome 1, complete genome n=1 Tax=Gibberella zeae (strain ATCC MYA-4620 / CBS 123657 / FGSC 9075 / NRRL 31084 / PH-1) TaxID=229533 RepID=I1S4X1_GIBZE|nr:hypothetical protein FGSG_11889 [Fusarium graminearum PH-1]ESU06344.1 hypothetical protein FGSG_11889 [Fusarium graminearum PH-1]CEF73138.1 unnamed protein product [Fusarium graminearum]CZS76406.1 unnamed protein product [Fusarium graminearum]|eukprot:XP_011316829.1 hypothetical protein FGSG_11889 [Fusarium graminearum PH-1]
MPFSSSLQLCTETHPSAVATEACLASSEVPEKPPNSSVWSDCDCAARLRNESRICVPGSLSLVHVRSLRQELAVCVKTMFQMGFSSRKRTPEDGNCSFFQLLVNVPDAHR